MLEAFTAMLLDIGGLIYGAFMLALTVGFCCFLSMLFFSIWWIIPAAVVVFFAGAGALGIRQGIRENRAKRSNADRLKQSM